MKKILIVLIIGMFIFSMLPGIIGESNSVEYTLKERKYKEDRKVIPLYTEHGFKKVPNSRGKPGAYVIIEDPTEDEMVSGTFTILIDSNYNPTISVDGIAVGSGLSYDWDTTAYADGSHTITASARGVTDTVTAIVNNNGGNQPPVVTITNPNDGATVTGDAIIAVSATDPEDGTLIVDIYIDGTYITSANTYTWDTTLYSDGNHDIYAEAADSENLTGLDTATVTVDNSGNPVDKYALVIGISDYEGYGNDLQYCDDDAVDWKNFLEDEGYTVTILTDSQATASGIEAAINELLADEDSNDYVAFTYSGHGAKYLTYGSCMISHDLVYITHGWLEQKFGSSESQHLFFTFDACQIGDFNGLIDTNKVGVFASDRKLSYDGDEAMQNGVFTYYQMDGWDNQGYDNFEGDGSYAIQQFKAWARARHVKVDPFVSDAFSGPMMP